MYFDDNGTMHVLDCNVKLITNINEATLSLNDKHFINNSNNNNTILNSNKENLIQFNSNNIIFNKKILTEYSMGSKNSPFQNIYCSNIYVNSNVNVLDKLNEINNAISNISIISKYIQDVFYIKPRAPFLINPRITLNLTGNSPNQLVYNLNDIFYEEIHRYELITTSLNVALYGNWLNIYPTKTSNSYTINITATNNSGNNTLIINIFETI